MIFHKNREGIGNKWMTGGEAQHLSDALSGVQMPMQTKGGLHKINKSK